MKDKKILVISLSGIGNTILFTPFLNNLRKHYPKGEIDFLAWITDIFKRVRQTQEKYYIN